MISKFQRFHASSHKFDFPDYEKMSENQTGHDNGLLGLWVSVRKDWIESFGENIYQVSFDGKVVPLHISELKKWASRNFNDPAFYREKRKEFLTSGIAYLEIIESDGRSEMGVVVDFSAIKEFKRLDTSPTSKPVKTLKP